MAVLAFPQPVLARQRARLAERQRQLVVLQERQAAELAVAVERVERERKALALLENSPRPEPRANETPGSSNAV